MHAFYHNPKLSRSSAENRKRFTKEKGIKPHLTRKKDIPLNYA